MKALHLTLCETHILAWERPMGTVICKLKLVLDALPHVVGDNPQGAESSVIQLLLAVAPSAGKRRGQGGPTRCDLGASS